MCAVAGAGGLNGPGLAQENTSGAAKRTLRVLWGATIINSLWSQRPSTFPSGQMDGGGSIQQHGGGCRSCRAPLRERTSVLARMRCFGCTAKQLLPLLLRSSRKTLNGEILSASCPPSDRAVHSVAHHQTCGRVLLSCLSLLNISRLRQAEQLPEVLGTVMLFSMLNRVVDA